MGRGRAPALAQGDLRFPSPSNAVGGGAEESFSGWDAPLRPRNALNIPLLRMAKDITFQPAGWPMTGPEKDAHHWEGEGRGGESPAPTSFRRKPPPAPRPLPPPPPTPGTAPAEAASSSQSLADGAGQFLAEASGGNAVTPSKTEGGGGGRVQGATGLGSLRGGTIMSEEQETPERKGSNFS